MLQSARHWHGRGVLCDGIYMITSTRNPVIKFIRDLQSHPQARREAQAFVLEGVRLAEEAMLAGWEARTVLYSPELSPRGLKLVDEYTRRGARVERVSAEVLKAASDQDTPQGILLVMPIQRLPLPPQADFLLILDEVRDPGNLGTILRTAWAAGVEAVLLTPGSVDVYSPKVVRSAMGAHFHLPIHNPGWQDLENYLDQLRKTKHLGLYLADATQGKLFTQADFRSPLALIVGGEAEGTGTQAKKLTSQRVHIPMPGKTESLNVAIATAILLFEVLRQRQSNP